MNNQRVVAADMNEAMRRIKDKWGENAYILETRTRSRKMAGSLVPETYVEVSVGLTYADAVAEGRTREPSSRTLEGELARLEKLVEVVEQRLEAGEVAKASVYPLSRELAELGCQPRTIERLAEEHDVSVPAVDRDDKQVALKHLTGGLSTVRAMRARDLRGKHVLLGSPGCGKTGLAEKLARAVGAAGGTAALISFSEDPLATKSAEERASALGLELACVSDRESLLGAVRYLQDRDLLLIDLPAPADAHWSLLEDVEAALEGEALLRHMIVAADGGWRGHEKAMGKVDFLAVTRADLAPALPPCLDLAGNGQVPVSFLSHGLATEDLVIPRKRDLLAGMAEFLTVGGKSAHALGGEK